ncbi:uncharacterized protein [Montipora capricornis]|uniref:uncharacterized protein isoform X2 n=1 Tax=Montipora capricornis TaxID=246305 RepID=UPI0035F10F32
MVFTVPDWFLVEQSEEHSAAIDRRTYFTTSALKSLCCQILCAICWKSFQPAYAQLVADCGGISRFNGLDSRVSIPAHAMKASQMCARVT